MTVWNSAEFTNSSPDQLDASTSVLIHRRRSTADPARDWLSPGIIDISLVTTSASLSSMRRGCSSGASPNGLRVQHSAVDAAADAVERARAQGQRRSLRVIDLNRAELEQEAYDVVSPTRSCTTSRIWNMRSRRSIEHET